MKVQAEIRISLAVVTSLPWLAPQSQLRQRSKYSEARFALQTVSFGIVIRWQLTTF